MKKDKEFAKKLIAYSNKYIAITPDNSEIIESEESLAKLLIKLKKKKREDVEIMFVPRIDAYPSLLCL